MSDKPTPAQRRALLYAIESGQPVRIKAGASASRMRANLLRAGWIEAMPVLSWPGAARASLEHCQHLGITVDQMAEALDDRD